MKSKVTARLDDAGCAMAKSLSPCAHVAMNLKAWRRKAKFAGNSVLLRSEVADEGTCNLDVKKVASVQPSVCCRFKIPIKGDKSLNPNQVQA